MIECLCYLQGGDILEFVAEDQRFDGGLVRETQVAAGSYCALQSPPQVKHLPATTITTTTTTTTTTRLVSLNSIGKELRVEEDLLEKWIAPR